MTGQQIGDEATWEGEDRFRTAFAHAAVGVAVTDAGGRFLEANPAYCRITGYTEEELRRLDLPSLTHPDDRPGSMELLRQLFEGQGPAFVTEKRYVRKDGDVVWVKASMSLVRDGGGRPLRIIALTEDVTEKKQAEDRLRESEERTRLLLDSTGEAIYGIDLEGCCTFCNPACLRLLGRERPEDLLGQNMHELIHHTRPDGSPYPQEECRIYRAFRRGEGTHVEDEVFWRADGTDFPVEYRSYPIRKGGQPIGSVVTFVDITERKRAEATIAEQMRLAEYGRDIGLALTRGGTLEELLGRCASATVRHLDGAFARIWTANEAGDVLELRASAGMYTHTDGPHGRVPVGRYKIGQIARERRPHLTNSVIGDPQVPAQDWAKAEGMVAFAGYPLVVEGRLVGVLAMFARHAMSDDALRMMGSVADEIAVGVERKRAEERLHRHREWLRVTLASIGDAVIATDPDGRVTFLNAVAEALTGWSQGEAEGRALEEVFHILNERTRLRVESPAARALREGQVVGLANHTVLIARDGTERAIDDSAAPIRDESGGVMGAVLIFRDVDERRRAERELEASEERLRMALEAGRMNTWAWDVRTDAVARSSSAEGVHGLESGTFPGASEGDLGDIHPEDRGRVMADLARSVEGGLEHHVEYRLALADGSIRWVEARGKLFRDEAGRPARMVGIRTDVSERKVAEGRLAEQTRITEALNRIGVLLAAELDQDRLVQVVTDEATRLTDARFGAFFYNVPDGRGGAYTLYTISGVPREAVAHFPMPRATAVFGPTFRGEGILRLDDVTVDPRYGNNPPYRGMPEGHFPVRSYLAVPVASRAGEVLGALLFGHPEPGVFTEGHERLVAGIASQAAVALDNARLYRQLHDSERRFRHLADAVPQVVWESEPAGTVVYFNRRWYEYTGLTPQASLGAGWRSAVHPDDLPRIQAVVGSLEDDVLFEAEYRIRGRDGSYRWHLGRAVPVSGDDGRVLRRYGTATDIDDRRRAEQTARFLAEASVALAGLVDYEETLRRVAGMSVPAFSDWCSVDMADDDGGLRRLAVTHHDPERLRLAHELFEKYPPDLDDMHGIGKVLRTGEPELVEEITGDMLEASGRDAERLRLVRKLGLRSYICVPLRPRGGTPGVITFVTAESGRRYDAGDLRVAEDLARRATVAVENAGLYRALQAAKEEAEAANQAKTQFLAVLSHELRTPLNPILLAASSMLERPSEPEEVRSTLEMIRQNVNLQARLIDDLLDVMRIVRGKMPLHWEVADCHRLIDQSVQICRSEILGKVLRVEVDLAASVRHVNADPARLHQVFWNLIKNAVKFTPPGGSITVRTRNEADPSRPERLIVVEVGDTGIGIEPEVLPRIFDPFQQGETTITRKFGGLGLGLAICKGIVDAHGGTLAARSPGKGQGTTFRLALKALPEPVVEGDVEPGRAGLDVAQGRPSSLRILVVEDEPATLRLMARLLRGLGHEVATSGTVAEATETARAGDFDLIVSDIGLPDGSGLDLMRKVRGLKGPIPAIALTGYGMEEDIRRSREAGFTAHLTKPIDFAKLEAMIRQVAF